MKSLFATNVLDILAVLYLDSDEPIHQSALALRTGLHRIQIIRALKHLTELGLIHEQSTGNMVYYKLNKGHPIYSDLKNILYKTILFIEPLKQALKSESRQINLAFIYGSIADGTETAESDIDLFIVGSLSLKKMSTILTPIAKQLDREINPIVYTKAAFLNKVKSKEHFIANVLRSKQLWIIGDENDLREMVK